MDKKPYEIPLSSAIRHLTARTPLLGASAPDEGIHDGGPGSDEDDPSAKERNGHADGDDAWGSLW